MKNLLKFSLFIIAIAIFAFSCDKLTTVDQATAKDSHLGELATSDVFLFSNGETDGSKSLFIDSTGYDTCFTATAIQNNDGTITKTLTFNGCNIGDGVTRSGQIIITYTPKWRVTLNSTVTVEFKNYVRGTQGDTINGTNTLKLTSLRPITIEMTAQNMVIKFSTGEEFKWEGTRTIQWLSGFATPRYRLDDSLAVNFVSEGYNRKGEHFTDTGTDLILSNCNGAMKISSGTEIINNIDLNKTLTVIFNGCGSYTINGIQISE